MSKSKIIIFAGTGGVGKTTLATSKAFFEASKKQKVLLITIDPSLRLKQLLHLEDSNGQVKTIYLKDIIDNPQEETFLDALCFNPLDTLKKLAVGEESLQNIHNNRILKILTQPFGGMNEIMAYMELSYHFFNKKYDLIVLDTPPGKNFLDFINVCDKINIFFNYYFFEIFKFLPSINKKNNNTSIFKKIISTGLNKILSYLEKVTGPTFVEEFIKTIALLYEKKEIFLKAATLKEYLNDSKISSIYFTSSIDQIKINELEDLFENINQKISAQKILAINKTLSGHLDNWAPKDELQTKLKSNLLDIEQLLEKMAQKNNLKCLHFRESLSQKSSDHLKSLFEDWNKYDNSIT